MRVVELYHDLVGDGTDVLLWFDRCLKLETTRIVVSSRTTPRVMYAQS